MRLTVDQALACTIRGDARGIIDGYRGVVEMDWCESDGETDEVRRVTGTVVLNLPDEPDPRVLWWSPDERIHLDNRAAMFLELPLRVPAVRDWVARWLGIYGAPGGLPLHGCGPCGIYPRDAVHAGLLWAAAQRFLAGKSPINLTPVRRLYGGWFHGRSTHSDWTADGGMIPTEITDAELLERGYWWVEVDPVDGPVLVIGGNE